MEYSFSKNDLGQAQAHLNMEAEAFGHWLSIDMSGQSRVDLINISHAVCELLAKKKYEFDYQGKEFYLEFTRESVTVSANSMAARSLVGNEAEQQQEFDEELWTEDITSDDELSDDESSLVASCGLEDFQRLLLAWMKYLNP